MNKTVLYHQSLCPYCRQVRLALFEKGISYAIVAVDTRQRQPAFLQVNPLNVVPTLVEPDDYVLSDSWAILVYLNETAPFPDLLGETPRGRAEVARLVGWFDKLFYREVYVPLWTEKVLKRLQGQEANSAVLRAGRTNLRRHLDYVEWLAGRKNYLAGRFVSYADFAAAAHLSVIDYLGEVRWTDYPEAAVWYAKLKSRPAFASLLKDTLPGIPPSDSYLSLNL